MNSVIQTVQSFMRHLSSSISEILDHAGGGHFEHVVKADVIHYTYDDFLDNYCQSCLWLFNDSWKCTFKYCADGSISHSKFSKVVLAYILGEVGNFHIVLLTVSSGTRTPFFYSNRFIFDRIREKNKLACMGDTVYNLL